MILLFDQNLSFRLTRALADIYPGALHVKHLGLTAADDKEIWLYAATNDCAIVSKDSDFYQRSLLHGHPPKVLWIRRGNCSTRIVEEMLRQHLDDIERFMLRRVSLSYVVVVRAQLRAQRSTGVTVFREESHGIHFSF